MTTDLSRFLKAQHTVFAAALQELKAGRKQSHWMWFIFPQLQGLGRSETSRYYGIADIFEAEAYLAHAVLGTRLLQCTNAVLGLGEVSAHAIFGYPDDLKFISSMTLFDAVAGAPPVFRQALLKFNGGKGDRATLDLLAR